MPLVLFGLDWSMHTLYLGCATLGGTVLVLQTLLLLIGVGDHDLDVTDHDLDASGSLEGHEGGGGGFALFSLRALASFFTFFGLTGWMGTNRGWNPALTVCVATASGAALMLAVAWLLHLQTRLQSKGNLDPRNAVGLSARVYLRIPGGNSGFGKITTKVQGRSAEFSAFTLGGELPTGALVTIVRMSTPDTFEVAALRES